jgi:ABC-type multidrug transport system fused ATPase/permease subunit
MSTERAKLQQLEEEFAQRALTLGQLRRVFSYLGRHKGKFYAALAMEAVWVVLRLVAPNLVNIAIDEGIVAGSVKVLALAAGGIFVSQLAAWLLAWVEIRWVRRAGENMLGAIRNHVFRHVQRLSMSFFDRNKAGLIIARADRDVDTLEFPIMWGPIIYTSIVLMMVFSASMMLVLSWKLFLAVLWMIVPMWLATRIFRIYGMRAYRRVRKAMARLTSVFTENITGVRVVQAFSREREHARRFRGSVDDFNRTVIRAGFLWTAYMPTFSFLYGLALVIAIFYGGRLVMAGEMETGDFVAFVMYLGALFGPIDFLGELYNETLSASSAMERIFNLLDTEPDVDDRPGARPVERLEGHVRFENVWFRYTDPAPDAAPDDPRDIPDAGATAKADDWILRDVSFEAPAGSTLALVGQTGAGKTTIVSLLSRFYEPQRGRVTIDGVDVADLRLSDLHRNMGIVLQDNYLFSGTVMDNLKFARPDCPDEEAIAAAKALGSHEIVENLPKGYDTDVEERGVRLSQGERQLICFTRAMVADPRILILDEATSAVDGLTEARIRHALHTLVEGRTTFVIAHRLSTIREADRILVIEHGRIVERGTHDDLVEAGGHYDRMYADYLQVD